MSVIWLASFAVSLAAPFLLIHYLRRLPFAPACPQCRGVTVGGAAAAPLDRLCAALAHVAVRSCRRCGWQGRMRWRLAPEHSHRRGDAR
jgi:hypothetical protein